MSFAMTKTQLLDGSKSVTRRLGWRRLMPGDVLLAVSKCMGLKPGETAEVYGRIQVLSVRFEHLGAITQSDVVREGFPEKDPQGFVEFFCAKNRKATPGTVVTRIEFKFARETIAQALERTDQTIKKLAHRKAGRRHG
jgi:hypothetical protein